MPEKQLPRGVAAKKQAEAYEAARVFMATNSVRIKHIRPRTVVGVSPDTLMCATSHRGGMTVAYRHTTNDSFIEVSTALCSEKDIYSRKTGTTLAVERFANNQTIRIPTFGRPALDVVGELFSNYFSA